VLVLVLALGAAGCDNAEKREAERLVETVTMFRRADNNAKPGAVENLRAVPCTAPDVCRARDACLASAEATAKALRLKNEVEQGLAKVEKGELAKDSPEAKALPKKLDEAETLLKEGHDGLTGCDDQIQALKRKHRF
jgi:hypothetical protein